MKGGWGWAWPQYKKGGGKGGKSKPTPLPEDFALDPGRVLSGTVLTYYSFNGYGFLTPDEKGLVPDDKVFVHWKNLRSTDRYPGLVKDMQVEFTVSKVEKNGVMTLAAENVTAPGGASITIQESLDTKKEFVGGRDLRYTGTLKFFAPQRGFGYIKIDPGFQYDREGVPEEIRVETQEMNCGGGNPGRYENLQIEFGIWVTKRGVFKGYNVCLPGGLPLPQDDGTRDEQGGKAVADADAAPAASA
ncbi:unnamed protein product [Prorocentrum cordatum]|uniref:CSD domain-containing protein n=1 Tax=Prorocentrum cordatum TaxID=2364126 RepID=A0ABN9TI83_9DINO|nr:unnamed protein product [Polarella glacialis]|mmetsp:Transcript_90170/g.234741  ORF Transcript_90170/g.234741 Transcript_90170/m.234741 type:complete len:245 (-) Transcript_90170:108-842(-)